MKRKLIKRFSYGLLILLAISCLIMLIPRAYDALLPEKPPLGYHFLATSYLAIMIGLEDLIERTPVVPEDIDHIKNIDYKNINGESLQLDFCKPKKLDRSAPLVVFLHGGGWKKGNRADMLPLMIDFTKEGYITATVSYRFGPYPQCVEDISDVVNWFYNHGDEYGYDPDRIALVGASAGAHLAMMAGYGWKEKKRGNESPDTVANKHHIKAIVNFFGPVDLTTDFGRNHPTAISFIGKTYAEAPELYLEASPLQYIDKNSPPTMTIQGTSDELVPNSQADQLKERLDSLGVPCVDYRFPLWPHAMILVQRVYDYSIPKMNGFFDQYLKQ
ncbi:alpha/beta hydrolase [Chryseolinea sp. T2]|uniref:alpha/beta hydrolase n=1 Tax=Chryseolinea sp. T2 TaxID=3129255 RepID=UPI00307867C3